MTQTEKSAMLRPRWKEISFDRALRLADSQGLMVISNRRAEDLLITGELSKVKDERCIYTSTLTVYAEPDKKIGVAAEYQDRDAHVTWVFDDIPQEMQSLKNAILAVEYPNYDLEIDEKRERLIVHPKKKMIVQVENFPLEDGWYDIDPITAIPINRPLDSSDKSAREFLRTGRRIGPVTRSLNMVEVRRGVAVSISRWPLYAFDVLVEQEPTFEAAMKQIGHLRERLRFAARMAEDAGPKLEGFRSASFIEPKALKELNELVITLRGWQWRDDTID